MKELIEKQFNITLDKNNFSVKKLYGGYFYFFKRELKQDHYFILEDNKDKVFILKHNRDNYNPSFTETGKQEDSFKINVDKVEEIKLNQEYPITIKKNCFNTESIPNIIIELKKLLKEADIKLNELEHKINE